MIIAATGHRPDKLGGYTNTVFQQLVFLAHSHLTLRRESVEAVISGMALGWDQAWATAAVELDIPVIAAIPFAGQEGRWPKTSQERYRDLLRRCIRVEVVSPGPYEDWKLQARNEWMVDKSDQLAALWNGTPGGTFNCMEYAAKVHKSCVNLWPQWEELCRLLNQPAS